VVGSVPLELVREDAERPGLEVGWRRAVGGGLDRGGQFVLERHALSPYDGPRSSGHRATCRGARECATGSAMPSKEELYDAAIDLFGDGKLEEAIARYREALAIDPDYVDAWHGIAMAYNELGRHQDAI